MSEFLEDFPTVSKEQAIIALEQAKEAVLFVHILFDECLPRRLKRELPAAHDRMTLSALSGADSVIGDCGRWHRSGYDNSVRDQVVLPRREMRTEGLG